MIHQIQNDNITNQTNKQNQPPNQKETKQNFTACWNFVFDKHAPIFESHLVVLHFGIFSQL